MTARGGQGEELTIVLPAMCIRRGYRLAVPVSPEITPTDLPFGRVLVVDDEPDVRATAGMMLEFLGHPVDEVGDGAAALEILGRADDIAVVLLDVTMPGLDGNGVLQRIRERWPLLPVLISSGYDEGPAKGHDATSYLRKPYSIVELRTALTEIGARTPTL